MRRFANFLSFGIALLFLNQTVLAEEHGTEEGQTEASSTERPEQDPTRLKSEEANLLSAVFRLPVPVINDLYGESIPKAVTKAMETNDETDISVILADLMGTLNDRQMETLVTTVESELTEAKEQENRDKRFIALMERMLWAGKIMLGDPVKNEASEKYNTSFNAAFAKRREKSELIHQKIQEALDGNEQAKKFLRDNLNRRSVLAFIDAQRKSGNEKLANDLLDALSIKEGNEKFIDTFASAGEPQRLKLGPSRESMEAAIQAYSDRNGGLHNVALANGKHERPRRIFKVSGDGGQLAVTENKPRPEASTAGGETPKRPSAAKPGRPQTASGGGKPEPKPPAQKPASNSGAASFAQLQSIVPGKCTQCHAGMTLSGSSIANARLIKDGSPVPLSKIITAIDNPSTGMAGSIDSASQATLRRLIR